MLSLPSPSRHTGEAGETSSLKEKGKARYCGDSASPWPTCSSLRGEVLAVLGPERRDLGTLLRSLDRQLPSGHQRPQARTVSAILLQKRAPRFRL